MRSFRSTTAGAEAMQETSLEFCVLFCLGVVQFNLADFFDHKNGELKGILEALARLQQGMPNSHEAAQELSLAMN